MDEDTFNADISKHTILPININYFEVMVNLFFAGAVNTSYLQSLKSNFTETVRQQISQTTHLPLLHVNNLKMHVDTSTILITGNLLGLHSVQGKNSPEILHVNHSGRPSDSGPGGRDRVISET